MERTLKCIILEGNLKTTIEILIHFGRFDYNVTYDKHYFYIYEDYINYHGRPLNSKDEFISWEEYKLKFAEEFI